MANETHAYHRNAIKQRRDALHWAVDRYQRAGEAMREAQRQLGITISEAEMDTEDCVCGRGDRCTLRVELDA